MSRLAMFCSGLFLACSMSGCCLMHGYGGYPGGGYYGGGGGACGGCNNGCAPQGYPSAGLYGSGMPQMAYGAPMTTAGYAPPYQPQMAAVAFDPLSTH